MTTTLSPPDVRRFGRLGPLATVPNAVTVTRTIVSVLLGLLAVATDRSALLLLAYVVYWTGDVADGWLARRLGQETRLGAVLDIVSDRACTFVLCVGVLTHAPDAWPVVTVFLLSFGVLDTMLSLAFLSWPIDSPNDFWRVDRPTYRWNWSMPAKAVNTAAVVGTLALGAYGLGLVVALVLLGVKVWSTARVLRLPV